MPAMPADKKPTTLRIRALDWHRGLAVLAMVECHALMLLHPSHDQEPLRQFLNSINGLIAPSFIFAAGFALALVSCRAAVDPQGRRERAVKTLMRIGEVLAVSNLLKWFFWLVRDQPWQWLRIDVLSCIGYSLLVLWACVFSLGNRPRVVAAVMAGAAALIFGLAPWTQSLRDLGVLQYFVNNAALPGHDVGSEFPVLPWAGYAFIGASLGALVSIPDKGAKYLWVHLVVMFSAGVAIANLSALWDRIYAWSPWILANAGERIWKVAAIALVLRGIEAFGTSRGWAMKNPLTKLLEHFGLNSLSGYLGQACILFGKWVALPFGLSFPFLGFSRWSGQFHWPGYWVMAILAMIGTGLFCWGWNFIDPHLPWRKSGKKSPATSPKPS
jgi:uncharacterized membrane protein